jgi:predicted secreted protein
MAAENSKIVYGGSLMLFIGTGATLTPLAFATSAKFDLTLDIREISSKDSGIWKEKASADGLVAYKLTGSTNGIDDLFARMIAREPVYFSFAIASGSTPNWSPDTSHTYLSGQMIISSLNLTANDNDTATYSVTLEGASAITMT